MDGKIVCKYVVEDNQIDYLDDRYIDKYDGFVVTQIEGWINL